MGLSIDNTFSAAESKIKPQQITLGAFKHFLFAQVVMLTLFVPAH